MRWSTPGPARPKGFLVVGFVADVDSDNFDPDQVNVAWVTGTDEIADGPGTHLSDGSDNAEDNGVQSNIWSVDETTGELVPTWINQDGQRVPTEVAFTRLINSTMVVTSNVANYQEYLPDLEKIVECLNDEAG
ncbi:hypothetical protein FRB90_012344 [Tulasnella sp. 427]|nr:hypothetical protein FRB90_012344 [Tulasnella sp. 427]